MAKILTDEEIAEALGGLPGWSREGDALGRQLVFAGFREVIAFLTLIAFDAEEADHHPDVTISYKRMKLSLTTHSDGGITRKDIALAKVIDERLTAFPAKG